VVGVRECSPALTPAGEAEWLRFKGHIEWSEHFALVFLFSDQPLAAAVFQDRLADYRARVTRLQAIQLAVPADLMQTLLPRLLHPSEFERQLAAPRSIDLSLRDDESWRAARQSSWRA
jgi:hypothetical protein